MGVLTRSIIIAFNNPGVGAVIKVRTRVICLIACVFFQVSHIRSFQEMKYSVQCLAYLRKLTNNLLSTDYLLEQIITVLIQYWKTGDTKYSVR